MCMRAALCEILKEYSMDEQLQKELEIQTQNFKGPAVDAQVESEEVASADTLHLRSAD
jgi:hypothetical protein